MGTLHVVATPIGNLEDITLRALRVLGEVDLIYAEDTRRTRVLLDRHGIRAQLTSLHAHNEASRIEEALAALAADRPLALVSDAGTPLVSDPGARLVAAAAEAGHDVVPLPGASAVLGALAGCGLRVNGFTFLGFLPRRPGPRRRRLARYAEVPEALVVFEAPSRIPATLADLAEVFGADRPACVTRELTKLHEEWARGALGELAERFSSGTRGEITVVIEGRQEGGEAPLDDDAVLHEIETLAAAGLRAKEIASTLAERTGLARRALYARAVDVLKTTADANGDAEERS